MRTALVVCIGLLTLAAISGCSNLETAPDERGIRYSGGAVFPEAEEFKGCQDPAKQDFGAPGDHTYVYPAGQRTFKFSTDPGSDAPPLSVSAPSPGGGQPIQMTVSGTVNFTPNLSNCDDLRRFHENIGRKYKAWEGSGWTELLSTYVKDPVDRATDNEALKFDWVLLSSNADAKARWEKAVQDTLPKLIEQQSGGNFFSIQNVFLQRPELPDNVKAAIADTEAARQQAQTAEQFKAAAASFPGGPTAYQEFLKQQAINKAIERGEVKVIPIPAGSPVIVQGN